MSEERLIADRIADLPTPAEHRLLVGHDAPMEEFADAAGGGRMHHAWLLAGPKGIGKATAAFRIAARVLNGAPLAHDAAIYRQIASGAHPGLLALTRPWDDKAKRFRTQLPIEEVRRTQAFFGFTGGGDRRVCIVDAADDMNASSANALLKILEEPPRGSLFLVVAHSPGRLLPTIRSRCRTLAFKPLPRSQVTQVVRTLDPAHDDDEIKTAVRIADGAPRTALTILQGNVLKQFSRFETLASGNPRWTDVHALAEAAAARGGEFETFLDLVAGWIGERMRMEAKSAPDGRDRSLVRWAQLWEDARSSRQRASVFNLDKKQVVLDLLSRLFETQARATTDRQALVREP